MGENFIDCERGRDPDTLDKVCRFNVDVLGGSCTWQKDYGYDEGQPCIILKLNRVSPLLPRFYCVFINQNVILETFHCVCDVS